MNKKLLFALALLTIILTFALSGCSQKGQDLEGKYIVTFELNEGSLNVGTSDVKGRIYYAYEPGSYIIDPSKFGGYSLTRSGYDFTGWYKDAACSPEAEWDFAAEPINSETLTLYAGWAKKIVYTYSVCYMDGENKVTLGTYTVEAGERFEDYRNYANSRKDFTMNGFYADAACTERWDTATKHPGGASDTDLCVYVDYIPGTWNIVDSYEKLAAALSRGGNVYLTADVDCGGKTLPCSKTGQTYTGIFEGNGYSISNVKVEKSGTSRIPVVAVFNELGEGAVIRNVSFINVDMQFLNLQGAGKIKASALAKSGRNCTVSDVTVTGKLITDSDAEFPALNNAFFEDSETATITDFTAEIVVEKQS